MPALPDFRQRYPDLELVISADDRPVDVIVEGIDCVLRGGPVHEEGLAVRGGDLYVDAALAGLGLIQAPLYHLAAHLPAGRLCEVLPDLPPPGLPLPAVYPLASQTSPRVRAWVEWLDEVFAAAEPAWLKR